ncbi:MAG: sulfite exporter TauE/SafE family protein [Anaerolineales bacterium]|nr:sulfite exporter TauE/SafE family protein [Anaerolineales bacterium]
MSLEYWFMFPVSILIATIAMASGVEGATFFAPFFLLVLRLPPHIAIGTGLITEVFGFASGLFAYGRKRLIDYSLGLNLLILTIPAAILGTWASARIAPDILKAILGVGLAVVGLSFLRALSHKQVVVMDEEIQAGINRLDKKTKLVVANGEEIEYQACNRTEGMAISGVGALFMGLVSTGLGEMNGYFLLQRCRVPSKVAVATSVFVVAITALIAASGHLLGLVQSGGDTLTTVLSLCLFTIPGVIIGGQLGSLVAASIPQRMLETGLGFLFILVAMLTLGQVIL